MRYLRILAFIVFGILADPTLGKTNQEAEDLAVTILTHVRQCLPDTASRSVDAETKRVRAFANMLMTLLFDPPELPKLQAAAIAAIDTATNPAATPDSLVRAAIAGVSHYLVSRSKSECERCQDERREPLLPTSVEAGTIRVITLPNLNLPEDHYTNSCAAFNHYFDSSQPHRRFERTRQCCAYQSGVNQVSRCLPGTGRGDEPNQRSAARGGYTG